jgi:hypothetical protein
MRTFFLLFLLFASCGGSVDTQTGQQAQANQQNVESNYELIATIKDAVQGSIRIYIVSRPEGFHGHCYVAVSHTETSISCP